MSARLGKRSLALLLGGMLCIAAGGAPAVTETLSGATYQRLQQTQKLLEAGKSREAIAALEQLATASTDRPYDYAMVMQYLAHAQIVNEQPQAALRTVTTALQRADLPPDLAAGLQLNQGKLLVIGGRYAEGLTALEAWAAGSGEPVAEGYYYQGYALYHLERYAEAQRAVEKALAQSRRSSDAWRELLLAAYVKGGAYGRAEALLTSWISRSPQDPLLWKRLAAVQAEHQNHAGALATLMVVDRLQPLSASELEAVLGLHRNLRMPDKAARLLSDWLQAGRLERSPRQQRLLADLWLEARERERAKEAFAKAAAASKDGELDEILGRLHMEDGEWPKAANALTRALAKGGLRDPDQTHLVLGVAWVKAGEAERAAVVLADAARKPRLRATAEHWLRVADRARDGG